MPLIVLLCATSDYAVAARVGYGQAFVLGENPYGVGFGVHGEASFFSGAARPLSLAVDVDAYVGSSVHPAGPDLAYTVTANAYHGALVVGWDALIFARGEWSLMVRPEAKVGVLISHAQLDFGGPSPTRLGRWSVAPTVTPGVALIARHGQLLLGAELVAGPVSLTAFVSSLAVNVHVFVGVAL